MLALMMGHLGVIISNGAKRVAGAVQYRLESTQRDPGSPTVTSPGAGADFLLMDPYPA